MKWRFQNWTTALLTAGTIVIFPIAEAGLRAPLLRCDDTSFEAGFYGTYFGTTYHGTDQMCGGDTLTEGHIRIRGTDVRVLLDGASVFNLYEVYWVPIGGDPTSSRIMVGRVITDCNGNVRDTLRDLATPDDVSILGPVDLSSRVGTFDGGTFFFYSRGPWGDTDNGSCYPSNLNTGDGTSSGTFNAPALWGGSSVFFDGVQFINGYSTF